VSAGARASPSWSGGRRRPTRCNYTMLCAEYCCRVGPRGVAAVKDNALADEFPDARGDLPAGGRFEQHRYFWPSLQEVGIDISREKQKRHPAVEERLTDYWRVTYPSGPRFPNAYWCSLVQKNQRCQLSSNLKKTGFSDFLPHKSQHGFFTVQMNVFSMTDLKDHSQSRWGDSFRIRQDKRTGENDSRIEGQCAKPALRII
jgi:hypothetical protein